MKENIMSFLKQTQPKIIINQRMLAMRITVERNQGIQKTQEEKLQSENKSNQKTTKLKM